MAVGSSAPLKVQGLSELEALFEKGRRDGLCAEYGGATFETHLHKWGRRTIYQGQPPEMHVKVWLPKAVDSDLSLSSKALGTEGAAGDPLTDRFEIHATNIELVRDYFSPALISTLSDLSTRYRIVMTDEHLRLGPFDRTPAESARDLKNLIEALPSAEPAAGEAEELEEDYVAVANAVTRVDADLVRLRLEAAGIPTDCYGYEQSAVWGAGTPTGAISVRVPASRRGDAEAALASDSGNDEGKENERFCYFCGAEVPTSADHCPECHHEVTVDK